MHQLGLFLAGKDGVPPPSRTLGSDTYNHRLRFYNLVFPLSRNIRIDWPLLHVSVTLSPHPSPSEGNPGELTAPETGFSLVLSSLC